MAPKSKSALYVGGSVLLIMLAIAATAIVNQTQNTGQQGSTDIRAKAGVSATLKTTGIVSLVDTTAGKIVVNNLRFIESTGEIGTSNLGSWTVTPPSGFDLGSVNVGNTVTMTIDPSTFLTNYHTVTATQIVVNR